MHIQIYDITNYDYKKYRDIVKDNKHLTKEQVKRKLSRNIALAKFLYHDEDYDQQFYLYGKLLIRTNHDAVITGLWNNRRPDAKWKIDCKKKAEINRKLGINY